MKTLDDLQQIREKAQEEMKLRESKYRIKCVVGMGTSGIAMGAREVMKALLEEVASRNLSDVLVTQTGEKGLSTMEPFIDVIEEGKEPVTYVNMDPIKVQRIIVEHIVGGKPVSDFIE